MPDKEKKSLEQLADGQAVVADLYLRSCLAGHPSQGALEVATKIREEIATRLKAGDQWQKPPAVITR